MISTKKIEAGKFCRTSWHKRLLVRFPSPTCHEKTATVLLLLIVLGCMPKILLRAIDYNAQEQWVDSI